MAPWAAAEAGQAARLARVAARLGALDDRLLRGPPGWRQRLALLEAGDLGWFAGDRVPPDRLAQWLALRLGTAQDDARVLARLGWAVRRLAGGPGPEAGLAAFLGRHDPGPRDTRTRDEGPGDPGDPAPTAPNPTDPILATLPAADEPLAGRIEGWTATMASAGALHPLTRACLGFHLWPLAGLALQGGSLEAAVTAARIAAGDCRGGAVFAPLATGGGPGLRAGGDAAQRLARWLEGAEAATLAAMRRIDRIEAWQARAGTAIAGLSGRTPGRLLGVLAEWPLVSAPMAEALTGASRAAVQRNLARFETLGLIREVTGQGRFRFWRAVD